jgi:hypothetical protein
MEEEKILTVHRMKLEEWISISELKEQTPMGMKNK